MENDYSKDALIEFMDHLGQKGLINKNTAIARKAAIKALLSIFDESDQEYSDIRTVDIDKTAERFMHLKGKNFDPKSIQVYKSRYKRAYEDFISYMQDPVNFSPSNSRKRVAVKKRPMKDASKKSPNGGDRKLTDSKNIILAIPLREGCVAHIEGLPSDLTEQEAQRIANVILALKKI